MMRPGEMKIRPIESPYPGVLGLIVEWEVLRNDGSLQGYFGGVVAFHLNYNSSDVLEAVRKFQVERREEWKAVSSFPIHFIRKAQQPLISEYMNWKEYNGK